MAHRKWKETKLQPGTAGPGNMLGCCLFSFHILWAILCPQAVQSSPLVWSTGVRSTRLYGQLLAGPNHRTLILISNPDIRSARLYGQFSLDKTLTLQAGSTVLATLRGFAMNERVWLAEIRRNPELLAL